MPDFGIMRGFGSKLFSDKLVAGQLPTQLGLIGSVDFGFDPDAQAFFNRVTTAGGTLSATEKLAVDTLVKQMKLDGIWTKMKTIYPMVGASAAACAQNLKSSSFTGTFSSGWTFASTGITPNGVSATFNTNYNPLSEGLNVNSNHHSVYLRTNNITQTRVDIGQNDNQWLSAVYWPIVGGGVIAYNPTVSDALIATTAGSNNLSINTRRSISDFCFFNNNVKIGTQTASNFLTFANANVHVGSAGGTQFFSNRENSFASIGDGLTDSQAGLFYTAVQAFQTTLSRQV